MRTAYVAVVLALVGLAAAEVIVNDKCNGRRESASTSKFSAVLWFWKLLVQKFFDGPMTVLLGYWNVSFSGTYVSI